MENERERQTNTQKKRFEKLPSTKDSTRGLDTKRTVVNISKRNLSEDEICVLAKGGKLAITPKQIPTEDIIANLEAAIRFLPEAQEIRTESAKIIKKAKPPKSNLKPKELKALRDINNSINITVLPALPQALLRQQGCQQSDQAPCFLRYNKKHVYVCYSHMGHLQDRP
nr:unnamed protein product [Callosobruchus analis]